MPDPLLDEAARIRTRSGRTAEVVGSLADRIADLEQDNEGLSRHTAAMERHRMGEARLAAAGRGLLDAIERRLGETHPADGSDYTEYGEGHHDALTGVIAHPEAVRLRRLVDGQPTDDREHLLSTALAYQATYTGRPTDDPWVQRQRDANDAEVERLQPTDEPTEADPVEVAAEAIRLHSNGSAHGSASVAVAALRAAGLVGGRSAAPTCHLRFCELPAGHEGDHRIDLLRSAAPTRDEVAEAIESHLRLRDSDEVLGVDEATDAVVALLSRSAAEPPEVAAHAVIRRLRTGWEPDIPCLGDEVWCWFHPDHDEPEPVTASELAVLEATKENG